MLHLIHGNRFEQLMARLVESLLTHPSPPLQREIVVVPSLGVARWLQYRIADASGVCAQIEFPYPAQFIWQSFARLLEAVPERSPFDVDLMTLRLYARLGQLPAHTDYAPLQQYLARSGERGRLDLAQQLARCYDQYLVYRPDWLAAWAEARLRGLQPAATERWQQRLWRHLLDQAELADLQHPADAVFARLAAEPALKSRLPPRIRVFGLSSLPPQYASVLARLGEHTDVEWYLPNPCRWYWADIVSERAQAQLALQLDPARIEAPRDVGHPLLASWGQQARDHLAVVMEQIDHRPSTETPLFAEPRGAHLLARLQHSLLDLGSMSDAPLGLDSGDRSIQLHACHSLTRQLEVLHDRLLAMFDADAGLRPADVLVMLPDPDAAAPMIDAVFGAAPQDRQIAYAITGSNAGDGTPLLRAFAMLLALPGSRFTASSVFDYLQLPAVAARYQMDAADLEQIRLWLIETGVRWGLDGEHRQALGLPAESRHTWLDGLQRLLLGYAVPTGGDALIAGVLPYDDIEGSQSQTLGKLTMALADLVAVRDALAGTAPLALWCDRLLQAIGRCFAPTDADLADEQRLRRALGALREDARLAGFDEPVALEVLQRLVDARLSASSPGGVPGGGVTFTGIGPLRGVPYRVICLLGLDNGAFPRNPSATEFDLMAAYPRRGDRARRHDDRGAFLDALLAARELLFIAYNGHSSRDNAELPPSVLVSELLDYLGRGGEGRQAVEDALLTQHPLQPFDARYFVPGPMQSYAREYLGAAGAVRGGAQPATPLFDGEPLPDPAEDGPRVVTLDQLAGFLRNPLRALLRTRLDVRIAEAGAELPEDEPFDLPERKWKLRDRLLRHALAGDSAEHIAELLAADADMPPGRWGRRLIEAEIRKAGAFAEQLRRECGELLPPLAFELKFGEITLSGSLDKLTARGRFAATYQDISANDWLDAWPRHLLLQLLGPAGVELQTRILDARRVHRLAPVAGAQALLGDLLAYYQQGQREPMSFAPKTAYALLDKPDTRAALEAWRGSDRQRGDSEEPYARMRYRGGARDLPPGFTEEAQRIFGPLFAARGDSA